MLSVNQNLEVDSARQSRSGGFFMPMMTGFMIGRMLSGNSSYGGTGYNPVYRYNNRNSSQYNRIMTADGTVIGKAGKALTG